MLRPKVNKEGASRAYKSPGERELNIGRCPGKVLLRTWFLNQLMESARLLLVLEDQAQRPGSSSGSGLEEAREEASGAENE